MRLTLRTMLAYLDDVLDPADAQDLGKKIRESEFASGLADRIRTVTRKLRIDAPKLDGKGMGNDPNTVAEYLDSTLPQDRVGDFERICLESDKHLCEVAACHQVLTLVLGKPAQVPMELRERVYALARPTAATAASPPIPTDTTPPSAEVAAPPVAGSGDATDTATPLVVPDYLRAGRRASLWPLIAAVAIAFLIGLGILRLMGPFDRSHPIARLVGGGTGGVAQAPRPADDDLQPPVVVTPPQESESRPPPPSEAEADAAKTKTAVAKSQTSPATAPAIQPDETRAADEATVATGPIETVSPESPEVAPAPTPERGTDEGPPAPAVADVGPADRGTADRIPADRVEPDRTTVDAAAADRVVVDDRGLPPPRDADALAAPDDAPRVATAPARGRRPAATAEPPVPPMDVGRYTSDAQVLATQDEATGVWFVKPARAVLLEGERLAVMAPYRPQIALPSGVQVTFAGESAVTMGRPVDGGASHMAVDWGRFIVVTVGAAGAQLDVSLAGSQIMEESGPRHVPHVSGSLTLVDADSSVAVRVSRWLAPGTDPEDAGSIPVVEIFSTHGRVQWHERGQESAITIPPRHLLAYVGDEPPEVLGPFQPPEWIDARVIGSIEGRAGLLLHETYLQGPKPLNVSLREAMTDRRVEIRSLAARCLAFLGDFEPVLRELSDQRQYSFWTAAVESLRQAVAAGPQSAAMVRATIERLRPADAWELYRLLWGYSQEQLDGDAAMQLVKLLDHEQMDVRVLTFYNLVTITGAHEYYRPERAPQTMRVPIQNWRQRAERGTIAWRTEPGPLWDYKPLAEDAGTAPRGPVGPLPPLRPLREER